jgi:hypothetical protein
MLLVTAGNRWCCSFSARGSRPASRCTGCCCSIPDRRSAAQRAARKKFVAARAGDAALLGAALGCWSHAYGTTDMRWILAAARAGDGRLRIAMAAAAALRSPPCSSRRSSRSTAG